MSAYGLLINYEWCSGCHSCEIACRNEHNIPLGQWGIKLTEVGPFKTEGNKWIWSYIPVPTEMCDLCGNRVAEGKKPTCVHHCLASCMEYGPVGELAEKAQQMGTKVSIFIP
jgi:Fe-S-cluster-containing dehydrogenase component